MNSKLERLRDVGALMIFGAAASPIIASTIGILLFTPLILAWAANWTVDPRQPSTRRAIVLLGAQTVAAQIVFHGWLGQPINIERATYALLPFAVLLAATCPLRYATIASTVLFVAGVNGGRD